MNVLIELLKQIDFNKLNINELLNNQNTEMFDEKYIKVYNIKK